MAEQMLFDIINRFRKHWPSGKGCGRADSALNAGVMISDSFGICSSVLITITAVWASSCPILPSMIMNFVCLSLTKTPSILQCYSQAQLGLQTLDFRTFSALSPHDS